MSKALLFFLTAIVFLCFALPNTALGVTSPVIGTITVTPGLAAAGDLVHVVANVTDDMSISSVTADGVALTATTSNNWEGDVSAAPALGDHTVSITANDVLSRSSTKSGGYYRTVTVVGINSKATLESIIDFACSNHLFRIWGKATYIDANTFSVSDGSGPTVKVNAPEHTVINGDYVWARGILDKLNAPPATLKSAQYTILKMAPRTAMTINNATVGKDLQASDYGTLPFTVPAGSSLKVVLSSTDPGKVKLAKTSTSPGSGTITLTVPGGSRNIPTFYVYGLASSGTVPVIATARGGYGKTINVSLKPSGFVISTGNISTMTVVSNTNVTVRTSRLDSTTLAPVAYQPLRGDTSNVAVNVTSSDSTIGTITNSSLVFSGNMDTVNTQFDPANAGQCNVSVSIPDGFSKPSSLQSVTAAVTAPDIQLLYFYDFRVGKDLRINRVIKLSVAPVTPVDITVAVADPTVATVSTSGGAECSNSITLSAVGNTSEWRFDIDGLSIGSTTLTVSAPGFKTLTNTIWVDPSGFYIATPDFNTTTASSNSVVTVKAGKLDPTTLVWDEEQDLRPGMPDVNVNVTSSNNYTGYIIDSPLVFKPHWTSIDAHFDPLYSGQSTISINTPAGFSTPSNGQSITATVTGSDPVNGPVIVEPYDIVVGKDLQQGMPCNLSVAPPTPVNLTVSVADPSIAIVSKDGNGVGSGSVTFTTVGNTAQQTFYVQGLSIGSTTFTFSAPGYTPLTKIITVNPSGFFITTGDFVTTVASGDSSIQVQSASLNLLTYDVEGVQPLRAGIPSVSVKVESSNPLVGTITNSPLVFNPTVGEMNALFHPVGLGQSLISVVAPSGFYTPRTWGSIAVAVY